MWLELKHSISRELGQGFGDPFAGLTPKPFVVASGAIAASTSVTLEVADVVPMPITGTFDGKGQTDGMLARVNSLRQEPAGAPAGASVVAAGFARKRAQASVKAAIAPFMSAAPRPNR